MEVEVTKTQLSRGRSARQRGLEPRLEGAALQTKRAANRKQEGLGASNSNPSIWSRTLGAEEEGKGKDTEEVCRGQILRSLESQPYKLELPTAGLWSPSKCIQPPLQGRAV